MPTKKEQTVEPSPKAKTPAKKTSSRAAKAALDLPGSAEAGGGDAAAAASPSTAGTPTKRPAKRTVKKTTTEERPAASIQAPPGSNGLHHEMHEMHGMSAPEAEQPIHGPSVTPENIAVRAYFIGEHRRAYGIPGNSEEDWLEAERQLTAEASVLSESRRGEAKS